MDREAPGLAHLVRTWTVKVWTPVKNDTMESPAIDDAITTVPASVYAKQWRALVGERPGLYLKVRAELFRWVFQPPDVGLCHPFHVGNQPGEEPLEGYVIVRRMDAHDLALKHYGEFFLWHTPVFSHALFALLGLGALVLLIRRREPGDIVMASLIVADFVFTATFFVISIACDYRYLFLIDLTALASALYVAADWRGLLQTQKRGP
jgi:MYXO-CTERM domain-containing protein